MFEMNPVHISIFATLNLVIKSLTDIDESSRRPATKLFAFEAECDFNYPWYVAGRRLDSNSMGGDQLAPYKHRAEQDLHTIKYGHIK